MRHRRRLLSELQANTGALVEHVARVALPLNKPTDLDPLLKRYRFGALCTTWRGIAWDK